ncbi:hybrid sensor histidine kinase/response regulator [Aliivibrio salmonicida]|uniref:histidine kinase n=1 Tax=Aliivibrio salmonicida (strain LFI1238) TaxID=316275 RepID=B6EQT3_ALISL|nr:response regulator [Aliivibrio salmonicida]AZL86477.1 hybrid sensor histidine kinase/response regulator [Aliivibrio salmonicida]CAQ81061.1 response regulator, histidine kinase [Aliivibrio salmonicida LFI1238]
MTFRLKTIIGISIIQSVMLLVLVLSSVKFLSDSNEQQLVTRSNATLTMFSNAIKESLNNGNDTETTSLMHDLIALGEICYVKIYRQDGTLIIQGGPKLHEIPNPNSPILNNASDGSYDIESIISSDTKPIGRVEIGFGTHGINSFFARAKSWIFAIAFIELFIVIGLSYLLGNMLTKNLNKLKKAVDNVAKQGPGEQLELTSTGDLNDVAKAFNSMSYNLQKNYHDLKEARIEAESANESKGRFLASMSHEIRTPMNAVLGLLAILKDSQLKPKQRDLVETATDSSELLLSIINDILDCSRMEANTFDLDNKTFNMHACLHHALHSFQAQADKKELQLTLSLSDNVPEYICGDVNRFRQILLNLIGNSLKFTDNGFILLSLDIQPVEDRFALTCIVKDSGIGIKAEQLDLLFEEFTMADNSFSRSHEGSGLGLAITKRLINMMDGAISVKSQYGKGSEFMFNIMLDSASEEDIESLKSPKDKNSTISPCIYSSARLLVVEDNLANQIVIKNTLSYAGYTIDIANNGKEAISMVTDTDYDLIFMDISMPEMDGMTATKKIRTLSKHHEKMPIIALTAHALSGDKERFIDAGMTDYLSKPFNRTALLECLATYLSVSYAQENTIKGSTVDKTQHDINNNLPQLLDESIIQQIIRDTDASVMPELIQFYIIESKERVNTIVKTITTKDLYALEFEAHTLGSSALTLGNVALSTISREIELHCIQQQFDEAIKKATQLSDIAMQSFIALEERNAQGFTN